MVKARQRDQVVDAALKLSAELQDLTPLTFLRQLQDALLRQPKHPDEAGGGGASHAAASSAPQERWGVVAYGVRLWGKRGRRSACEGERYIGHTHGSANGAIDNLM